MSSSAKQGSFREIFSPETFPVFLMFFFWAFGTGGLWLVRPLFAYETGGTFLLVALISSVSAMPRIVTGPLTGFLTDRYGRKPFVIIGSVLHIAAMVGDFFIGHYYQFLLLEILGGIGISVWMTSANVLMADATRVATRGRAVAVRDTSNRVGLLAGPIVGGLIGATLGLRYIFLFIAATKVAVIIVTVLWIREARRQRRAASPPAAGVGPKRRPWLPSVDLAMFRTRAFFALSLGTISVSLVVGGTGVFRTLFPPHTSGVVGLDTAQIGTLIAISGAFALLGSIPTGMAADRWGRKKPLLAGLLLTAVATYLMAGAESYASAGVAVVVFGVAEALAFGTIQVYAMDLAPPDRRGAFLGVWSLFMNIGQITGPLVIGTIADTFSFSSAFITVSIALVVGAAMVALFGTETGGRNRSPG